MKSNKTGCPPERGCDLENCIVGASKAAWFAIIAIGWQRYPLAQAPAAVKGLTHESGKSLLTISTMPVGVGAASQLWIPNGEESGLWTRIATKAFHRARR
jgi:hypothetical protein